MAVRATVSTISSTVQPRDRSLTGLFEPLENGAHGHGVGSPLHCLVGVVAGVEIREDEDRGLTGDGGIRRFQSRHLGIESGIVLQRPVQRKVEPLFLHHLPGNGGRLHHLLHILTASRRCRWNS